MHTSPANRWARPAVRIASFAVMTLLLSGWTCSALFVSCQGVGSQPEITSLSPDTISSNAESVQLTVVGSGFTPQSHILWNGKSLPTTLTGAHHLQTTINRSTFESFGGSQGGTVQISVGFQASGSDSGCPPGGNSDPFVLKVQ